MRSLTRVLRLAGVLSASPCSASLSASSRHPSKSTNSMAARISTSSSAAAALSRARLIRSRPGFVPAITTTSTRRPATTTRATGRQQRAFAVASTAIARRQRLRNGASSSTSAAALERWFVPGTPSARSPRRLFSTAPAEVSTAGNRGEEEEVVDGAAPFKVNLLEMDNEEVEQFLVGLGEPKYRAQQVLKWMYEGGAGSFEDMSNLPKALRAKLTTVATVGVLEVAAKQTSKDGTKKLAYRLSDGQLIESVLMPYSDGRRTACISSQAGCAMDCVFCATGQMGFKRQLSSAEIFEQAYRFSQELAAKGDRLSNVVFMGMGEPLANYKNVMEAVRRINTELGIGARHITISTVGLVPRIMRLSQEDIQVKLAVSLHAANDRERSALLPVNRRFPLSELMDACREYVDVSGRRMTFEWALIRGENDTAEVASELGRLLRPLKGMCHVNIIPLNPTEGYKGGPSVADAVNQFVEVLARHGVPATPRTRRGIDIDAGCGQLTVKVEKYDVLGKGL